MITKYLYHLRFGLLVNLLIIFLLGSCGTDENIVVFTDQEIVRLLSNDSTKIWDRRIVNIDGRDAELSECDLYTKTKYISRNDSLIYITESSVDFCGGDPELLDSGYWEPVKESNISERIDKIAYYSVQGDSTIKMIREITARILTIETDSDGSVIKETFESRFPY